MFRSNKTVKAQVDVTDEGYMVLLSIHMRIEWLTTLRIVWTRLEPVVRKLANEIHEKRASKGRLIREQAAQQVYRAFRVKLGRWLHAFMPISYKSLKLPLVEATIDKDVDDTSTFRDSLGDALSSSRSRIGLVMRELAELYTRDLPNDWARLERVQLMDGWDLERKENVAVMTRLDLAVYVFGCMSPVPDGIIGGVGLHFGMEGLAHHCAGFEVLPNLNGHAMVLRILDILSLNPATTAPRDLDRLDKRFIRYSSDISSVKGYRGYMTWREVARTLFIRL